MVPVEITAFGVLAVCVIVLAVVQAIVLLARPISASVRAVVVILLVAVAIAAVYVWATTRMP